jgi:MFS transporter, DHA1 family, tetracycline resistance protein
VPFYAAAALCVANATYGYFILPETLPREKRRPFELMRANPFGLLKVFATYRGVLQLALVMFIYFLASAVYPAIWPFWAIARFGWSEAMIGLSLAAFGLVTAICQGMLTGPAVKRFGERKAALIGLFCAIIGVVGYGLAGGIISVIILMILHAPEGFVHPALAALMSNQAPEDAQGELQGGISSLQNLAMVIGTVIFSQVFGFFTSPAAPFQSTGMAFFVSGALLTIVLIAFVAARKTKSTAR